MNQKLREIVTRMKRKRERNKEEEVERKVWRVISGIRTSDRNSVGISFMFERDYER